jgi:hypothetical protein
MVHHKNDTVVRSRIDLATTRSIGITGLVEWNLESSLRAYLHDEFGTVCSSESMGLLLDCTL